MVENPFQINSFLNAPLARDIYEGIHYRALRAAVRGVEAAAIPGTLALEELRQQVRYGGLNTLLASPGKLQTLFGGVTLLVYQAISTLYNSREGRSISMTWQILDKMAQEADATPVDYEAVWAICMHLHQARARSLKVDVEHLPTTWSLGNSKVELQLLDDKGQVIEAPHLAYVIDINVGAPRVLAFRVGSAEDVEDCVSLALYDAIVSARTPSGESPGGLRWYVPAHLLWGPGVSDEVRQVLDVLNVGYELTAGVPQMLETLQGEWGRDLSGGALSKERFYMLFDRYLARVHGYGPRTAEAERNRTYEQLASYDRDPAEQFPAMRDLIPARPYRITGSSVSTGRGPTLQHPFLRYWEGSAVEVRRSEYTPRTGWVYLDRELLCKATA